MKRHLLPLLAGTTLFITACVSDAGSVDDTTDGGATEPSTATPTNVIEAQIAEVEAYWLETGDTIGLAYETVAPDRIIPRSALEDGTHDSICSFNGDEEILDPDDVIDNAFVTTCDEGITVVYDDIDYLPELDRKYDGAGAAMLFAHEWGHVIQFQMQLDDQDGLTAEQQADCWSGSYAAWAEENGIEPFTDPSALDLAIISTLETRDEIGVDPEVEDSHGNGFDRIRATQEGYEQGAEFCNDYTAENLPITQIGFLDDEDEDNAGNLPFDDANELLDEEVAEFFESLTDESLDEFLDPPSVDDLEELYDFIGDNAVGTEYALRYAEALQEAEGFEVDTTDAALQRACLTGAWLNNVLNAEDPPAGQLSPFDLDESIQTFSTSDDLLRNPGLVFDMIDNLRIGTIDGLSECGL